MTAAWLSHEKTHQRGENSRMLQQAPAACTCSPPALSWLYTPSHASIPGARDVLSYLCRPNRYIAITTLAIIAVFLEYLRQLLIDLHQIYRHSSVPKTRLRAFFQLLSSSGFTARRRRDFFLSRCACHGVANPSPASH